MDKVYKCTTIDDFFPKLIEKPKTVACCNLCQKLGVVEGVCFSKDHNRNENEHTKIHQLHLRLITNSSTKNASRKKLAGTVVQTPAIETGSNNLAQSIFPVKEENVQRQVNQKHGQMSKQKSIGTCSRIDQQTNDQATDQLKADIPKLCQSSIQNSIACQDCSQTIPSKGRPQIICRKIVDHVLDHLKMPIFRCLRCSDYFCNHAEIADHLKQKHNTWQSSGEYEDLSGNCQSEIRSMLAKCFDKDKVDQSIYRLVNKSIGSLDKKLINRRNSQLVKRKGTKSRIRSVSGLKSQSILAIENQIVQKESNQSKAMNVKKRSIDKISIPDRVRALVKGRHNNGRLLCAECGSNLKVTLSKNAIDVNKIVGHLTTHIGKFMFACRLCSHRACTLNAIRCHISTKHGLGRSAENFINSMAHYKKEIIEMLQRCFGQEANGHLTTANQQRNSMRVSMEHNVRMLPGQNLLLATRQSHCRALAKRSICSDSLTCRLCSKNVFCAYDISSKLLFHILTAHLKKQLYRCRLCFKTFSDRHYFYLHKRTHGLSKVHCDYDDLSNDYHEEIMSLLSKCFDNGQQGSIENGLVTGINTQQSGDKNSDTKVAGNHMQNADQGSSIKCPIGIKMRKGIKDATFTTEYHCQVCAYSTRNELMIKNHLAIMHSKMRSDLLHCFIDF